MRYIRHAHAIRMLAGCLTMLSVMGYETSKLITSDTDLERGNAQRERRKIATTC